jgi:putative isomerase
MANRMVTRRNFIEGAAGLVGTAAMGLPAWAAGLVGAATSFVPNTTGGKQFANAIGEKNYQDLCIRMGLVNANVRDHGLRTVSGTEGKLLTGYPYNEFYDWDLYFENLYLSYFGVWEYCFTNLKEFLNRQQSDGYISRSLIKQRDRQHFKPFLAQLVVLGCKQNKNDYEWLRGNYYERLDKYLVKWVLLRQ